ncbi:MAG: UDP-N-acetylmuramoyl-tripeptide--D-alanyl-D-alanine ligase [Candidatus Saccharimonadales bacterium]
MKKLAKRFVAVILGWQVRRLAKRHDFKVVAIAGSIGKSSTKLAIVKVLQQKFRVQFQEGNYNDLVSVPLIFFGQQLPSLYNPLAWLSIFLKNESYIKKSYPYDIVVVELGSDGPGQLKDFKSYLKVDLGVLTAITPEHMEFFKDLDDVAAEELTLTALSGRIIVNYDLCPPKYLKDVSNVALSYGIDEPADVRLVDVNFDNFSSSFKAEVHGKLFLSADHESTTEPLLYGVLAAIATGYELGMTAESIEKGLRELKPMSGRMQILAGINSSVIIDDTYNASPEATKAALKTLYRLKAPQKIAILGNMNELGSYSKAAHEEIGKYCDPKQLDLVVTVGPDANQYLAKTAEQKGCIVERFDSPYKAGGFLKGKIRSKAIVLAKGSQNGVFAEEAIKFLLANPTDAQKLVRQSPDWLKQKAKSFS